MKLINIIIPCLNEVNNIDALIAGMDKSTADLAYQFNYLFIDDGSSDGTFEHLATIHCQWQIDCNSPNE